MTTIGWNVSHQFSPKDYRQCGERQLFSFSSHRLSESLRGTFKQTLQMLSNREQKGNPYLRPTESVRYLNESLRKQKEDEKVLRDKIFKESVDKAASKERQAALIFRYLEEKKLVDAQVNRRKMVREFTGKPDLTRTLKPVKEFQYYHEGIWGKTKLQDKEIWSCCASEVKESIGCHLKVVDKMAWKYST